jgi:hypothetical protein
MGVERSQRCCGSWGIGSTAHEPLPNSARAGRISRKLTLPCCLSLAALRSRTIRVSLGAFDEVPEVSPRERGGREVLRGMRSAARACLRQMWPTGCPPSFRPSWPRESTARPPRPSSCSRRLPSSARTCPSRCCRHQHGGKSQSKQQNFHQRTSFRHRHSNGGNRENVQSFFDPSTRCADFAACWYPRRARCSTLCDNRDYCPFIKIEERQRYACPDQEQRSRLVVTTRRGSMLAQSAFFTITCSPISSAGGLRRPRLSGPSVKSDSIGPD